MIQNDEQAAQAAREREAQDDNETQPVYDDPAELIMAVLIIAAFFITLSRMP